MTVESAMPPLAEVCASFKGFSAKEQRGDRIFEMLLAVIQRSRGAAPKRFYPMREVASFFGVALSTVETVFHRLGKEGALILVRSSQTMIPARKSRPRFAVRGVICMPIWTPGFLFFLDWRKWFSELEQELSHHRFVLEPIFFGQNEETDPAFVDRVLKFNPDYVLWNNPALCDRMTMESITDAGVPILTVISGKAISLPGRIYRQSFERGLQRGLKEWQTSGEIDRIVVPQHENGSVSVTGFIKPSLANCPLPHQFKTYTESGSLSQYLERLAPEPRTGIIFDDDLFFCRLCALVPQTIMELFRRHRTMVMRQVTIHQMKVPTDVTVDSLLLHGKRLAHRIVADLHKFKGAPSSEEIVFEADWRPHTPLVEISQNNFAV